MVLVLWAAGIRAESPTVSLNRTLSRDEIQNIKIIPQHTHDKVTLYITGKDTQKYRISGLSHKEALGILGRMKTGNGLELMFSRSSIALNEVLAWK